MNVNRAVIGFVASVLGLTVWLDEVPCGKAPDTSPLDPD
jgi:hypothetical protein